MTVFFVSPCTFAGLRIILNQRNEFVRVGRLQASISTMFALAGYCQDRNSFAEGSMLLNNFRLPIDCNTSTFYNQMCTSAFGLTRALAFAARICRSAFTESWVSGQIGVRVSTWKVQWGPGTFPSN